MAGCILVGMGFLRLGALIQIVPYPVTVGFTAGIGVVIATAMVAIESMLDNFRKQEIRLIINNLKPELIRVLEKVGILKEADVLKFTQSMDDAVDRALIAVAA